MLLLIASESYVMVNIHYTQGSSLFPSMTAAVTILAYALYVPFMLEYLAKYGIYWAGFLIIVSKAIF